MKLAEQLANWLARLLRALPALLALGLVIALGWRAAHWTWAMLGEHRSVAVTSAVPPVPDAALAQHWFGIAAAIDNEPAGVAASNVGATPAAAGSLALRGLIAGGSQPLAIIDVAGTSWQVQVGERFADRYTLESITRDELVVDDGGQRRVLSLPTPNLEAPATDAPAAALAPQGAVVGQSMNARSPPPAVSPAVGRAAQRTGRP